MKEKANTEMIINDFLKAWQTLDAELICRHLDESFRYDSQWVFEFLDCKGYKEYIRGKFETLRKNNVKLEVAIVADAYLGGEMLAIKQDGNVCYYRIKVKDDKVVKGDLCAF